MQHLTAKKLLPRPVAPWHHSFCSSCWCNQSAWRKAELTEALNTSKLKGETLATLKSVGILPPSSMSPGFHPGSFRVSLSCQRTSRAAASGDNAGGEMLWSRARGKHKRSSSTPRKHERTAHNCKDSDSKSKVRERRKQKHTKKQQQDS